MIFSTLLIATPAEPFRPIRVRINQSINQLNWNGFMSRLGLNFSRVALGKQTPKLAEKEEEELVVVEM